MSKLIIESVFLGLFPTKARIEEERGQLVEEQKVANSPTRWFSEEEFYRNQDQEQSQVEIFACLK
jgi:hypothetical protein